MPDKCQVTCFLMSPSAKITVELLSSFNESSLYKPSEFYYLLQTIIKNPKLSCDSVEW